MDAPKIKDTVTVYDAFQPLPCPTYSLGSILYIHLAAYVQVYAYTKYELGLVLVNYIQL